MPDMVETVEKGESSQVRARRITSRKSLENNSFPEWLPTSLGNKWRWLVQRPKVVAYCTDNDVEPDSLKSYNFRHSAISKWVDGAGDIYVAAQIFGTSVKMIETRYGHPNVEKLHEKFLAFMAAQNPAPIASV